MDFYDNIIYQRFASGKVPNYVFDVYIDKRDRVWLLDFNVWSRQTDGLLFEWEEILHMAASKMSTTTDTPSPRVDKSRPASLVVVDHTTNSYYPEIRVVETANEIHHDPLASYRAPIDTVEIASMVTSGDATKFEEFMKLCKKPSELEDTDA
jgi:hypothetical protein